MVLEEPAPVTPTGPLRPRSGPAATPLPGEVLVEVSACAVCRTDLQLCEGDLPAHRLPIVPGHQVVGRVVAMGDGVDASRLGQRVGVAWLADSCGRCRFCRRGLENLCEVATFTGWDRDGGYAHLLTAAAHSAHPLPEDFDDLSAAPLLCGGVIGYRSLRLAGVGPASEDDRDDHRLGLFGFGSSATVVAQVAAHWGWEVYAVTRSAAEQQRALGLGAAWAGSYDDTPPVPFEAAITFAPVGWVVIRALEAVDRGGTVAINAIHLDRMPEFDYGKLWHERVLRSVANVTRSDVREFLELAPLIPVRTDIEVHPLEQANEALTRVSLGRVAGTAVLEVR
ncbi:MAG: alcohol dehydrogenase, propanol-preferring [Acidimicrobiia bacterium]|nr:alcohol dehydrogenase, propanol-preferring [Acidimicrobiia bacterium]